VSIESAIAAALIERQWRLALAETTTGGLISVRFVRLPGSSAYFDRGVVAYSQAAKVQALDVDPQVMRTHGVVSAESVRAMAQGLQRLSQAHLVLAETGIAGPIRGRSPKPLGMTYFVLHTPTGLLDAEMQFDGDRHVIQEQIAEHALNMMADYLGTGVRG
jgi:PncC family amidohydrolase